MLVAISSLAERSTARFKLIRNFAKAKKVNTAGATIKPVAKK